MSPIYLSSMLRKLTRCACVFPLLSSQPENNFPVLLQNAELKKSLSNSPLRSFSERKSRGIASGLGWEPHMGVHRVYSYYLFNAFRTQIAPTRKIRFNSFIVLITAN